MSLANRNDENKHKNNLHVILISVLSVPA